MNHISSSQLQNVICSRWLHIHKLCLSTFFKKWWWWWWWW